MTKAMIISVGGTEQPIIKSIHHHKPEFVSFSQVYYKYLYTSFKYLTLSKTNLIKLYTYIKRKSSCFLNL